MTAAYVRKAFWANPPGVGGKTAKASSVLKPCSITQYAILPLHRNSIWIKGSRVRKRGVVDTRR